tara:strand:- start:353 stop:628 length:276 start_codon:yes stop_codon:yes gene_type:complete
MAVPRVKYSMQMRIRYKGNLVDCLDRIRAIRLVLMVHIEQDLGKGAELITVKVMTPYSPRKTFYALRKMCVGKIETLEQMQLLETTLTKLN